MVVLVSSGLIRAGREILGWFRRLERVVVPVELADLASVVADLLSTAVRCHDGRALEVTAGHKDCGTSSSCLSPGYASVVGASEVAEPTGVLFMIISAFVVILLVVA